ncbi:cystatin [Salmo salar]|uniref:Cystatin n=1 Tax=Salmo salar TaxID=8030 RepID=B5X6A6_SALSA|nr:cystatin [Salmo salar]ACI66376.1 Cystatin precursor [Salmo salar]ACI69147.1 Cystatin precursor [Salmo salar]ACI69479.1 Cystatin precursor [Salmo salar]ACN10082.1 Cystatin precursor [Salmo salar]ACN12429.1 Cystatin precursor [Salmo salar]|eukprot:XP_014035839.1 PREDICTED: cystatin-like [Salmo salar]
MTMNWKIVVPLLAVTFIVASVDGMPGGVTDANMNDQTTKDALQFAVAEYNKATNDLYVRQVAKVVKAQRQVVAGMKYIFTVQMARTLCRKGGVVKDCAVHQDPAATYQCIFEVWSQPWLGAIQLIKNDCQA